MPRESLRASMRRRNRKEGEAEKSFSWLTFVWLWLNGYQEREKSSSFFCVQCREEQCNEQQFSSEWSAKNSFEIIQYPHAIIFHFHITRCHSHMPPAVIPFSILVIPAGAGIQCCHHRNIHSYSSVETILLSVIEILTSLIFPSR